MARRGAFTLIEILVSVAIIALLISIAVPSLSAAKRVSRKTFCQQNLHQIGVGLQAYLQSPQSRECFPTLSPMPSIEAVLWPPLSPKVTGPRPGIARGLAREFSAKSKVFECPADAVTELSETELTQIQTAGSKLAVGKRYYDSEETSYEWRWEYNGVHRHAKKVNIDGFDLPVQLWNILHDYSAFHGGRNRPGSINSLYPDLHVEADKK